MSCVKRGIGSCNVTGSDGSDSELTAAGFLNVARTPTHANSFQRKNPYIASCKDDGQQGRQVAVTVKGPTSSQEMVKFAGRIVSGRGGAIKNQAPVPFSQEGDQICRTGWL